MKSPVNHGCRERGARLLARFAPVVIALVLGPVLPAPARAEPFGPYGLAIKTGEGAGGFGAQLAYNFTSHWQACAGVGGASIPYILEFGHSRTDSYFLMGKYFLHHLYFGAGYSQKRTRVERSNKERLYRDQGVEHGLLTHLGYEFGNRQGFFFSTSIGFLYIPGGGGRTLIAGEGPNVSEAKTAATGPSIGITLGHYFQGLR